MNIRMALFSLGLSPLFAFTGWVTTPVDAQEQIDTADEMALLSPPSEVDLGRYDETLSSDELEAGNQPLLVASADSSSSLDDPASVSELFSEISRDQLEVDNAEGATLGVVQSVDQLSDVSPTDWAYQALSELIQNWNCIAGYPDGTFRGQQKATRFELAAALNECLNTVNLRFATKEELEAVKKLQEEFAAELAILKGRVDQLEARTDLLEDQQFSTTTKLSVNAVMAGQYGDSDGPFVNSTDGSIPGSSNPTAIAAVYMSFNTSFTGDDLLETTLFYGNAGEDFLSVAGLGGTPSLPFGDSTPIFNPGQFYFSGVPSTALLYRLAYTFKPVEDLSITAAPLFYPTDIIDGNSYTSPFTGFSSWFFINNPLITPYINNFLGGAGGGFNWNPNGGPISVRGAYVAVNAGLATNDGLGDGGLFDDPYQGTVEFEYADDFAGGKNSFAVRAQYTNSATSNIKQNVGGLNVELNLGRFGIFGRYGYAASSARGVTAPASGPAAGLFPPTNPIPFSLGGAPGTYDAQTFQAGVGVKDLLVPGSLLAAAVGQPFINNLPSGPGVNDETQTNIEAFYRFPINNFITVSPIFTAIIDANNSSAEPNIYQGILRVVFSF